MTAVTLDAATLARLHGLKAPLEVRDESGHVLGYFHPLVGAGVPPARSPFTDEELQRRRQQRTGLPLPEVLKRLGSP